MFLKTLLDLRSTLAFRLTSRLTGIFSGCTIVLFAVCYVVLSHFEHRKIDDELDEDAIEIGEALTRRGIDGALEAIENEARSEGVQQAYFEIYDASGILLKKTDSAAWSDLSLPSIPSSELGESPVLVTATMPDSGDHARVHIVVFSSGEKLISAFRLNDLERILNLAGVFFGVATTAIALLAVLLGWRITRKAMEGVEEVTQTARTIAAGRFDARVNISGWGTEIERLALTFNEMIGRIGYLMRELAEMGDNIAHDLRTPVMRIRTSAESLMPANDSEEESQSAAGGIIEECERLLGFINTRLDISEAESGITANHFQEMDIAALVQDIAELYQPAAEDKGLSITVETPAPVRFIGERGKIQRLLANLLDNAVKYSPRGGVITVSAVQLNETISICVRDRGVGISPESLPHVFERYYRADASRSIPGNGLGLSYVRAVARAWGGDAKIESSLGAGTTVTVTLPRKASPQGLSASANIAKR